MCLGFAANAAKKKKGYCFLHEYFLCLQQRSNVSVDHSANNENIKILHYSDLWESKEVGNC